MASANLPYFRFYVKDFAGDGRVEAMSTCAVGAYMLLLCKAWHEDPPATIPDDDRILSRWARLNPAEWSECKQQVLSCWRPCGVGRLIQPRLRREFDLLRAKSNQQRLNGALGGRPKATAKPPDIPAETHGFPRASGSGSDSGSGSRVPRGTSGESLETPRAEVAATAMLEALEALGRWRGKPLEAVRGEPQRLEAMLEVRLEGSKGVPDGARTLTALEAVPRIVDHHIAAGTEFKRHGNPWPYALSCIESALDEWRDTGTLGGRTSGSEGTGGASTGGPHQNRPPRAGGSLEAQQRRRAAVEAVSFKSEIPVPR